MHIGCVSVVEHKHGYVTAIRCAKGRGIILPGGKWQIGETFAEAAARELKEETGLVVTSQSLVFHSMAPDFSYCYAFHTDVEDPAAMRDSSEGTVLLAKWDELFTSFFGPWYRLLYDTLAH